MNIITDNNKLYEEFSDQYWEGFRPIHTPTTKPYLSWKGPKISLSEWRTLMSFFLWQYDRDKCESQAVLYFNPSTGQMKFWVRPQEGVGMTTKELDNHPNRSEDDLLFSSWIVAGTVHHHCATSAFQSGTDTSNEQLQTGLHITVGNLNKDKLDLHTRVVYNNMGTINERGEVVTPGVSQQYGANLPSWFEAPQGIDLATLPYELVNNIIHYMLTVAPSKQEWDRPIGQRPWPQRWEDNLIKKTYSPPSYPTPYPSNHYPYDGRRPNVPAPTIAGARVDGGKSAGTEEKSLDNDFVYDGKTRMWMKKKTLPGSIHTMATDDFNNLIEELESRLSASTFFESFVQSRQVTTKTGNNSTVTETVKVVDWDELHLNYLANQFSRDQEEIIESVFRSYIEPTMDWELEQDITDVLKILAEQQEAMDEMEEMAKEAEEEREKAKLENPTVPPYTYMD